MKEFEASNLDPAVAQAIEEMQIEQGDGFSLEKINLAELGRRTGISRHKLRRMKENGFVKTQYGLKGRQAPFTLLTGYTAILDDLLRNGIVNSSVCLKRLQQKGFPGRQTIVKEYIASHQDFVPAKRWYLLRAAVAVDILRNPEKPTRWTGASRKLPDLVPARSMACTMVSVVRTPNMMGIPLFSATLATPLDTSLHT